MTEDSSPDRGLITTKWNKQFVFFARRSTEGTFIRPFSTAYTRFREEYTGGQLQMHTDWLKPSEYTMRLLKGRLDA